MSSGKWLPKAKEEQIALALKGITYPADKVLVSPTLSRNAVGSLTRMKAAMWVAAPHVADGQSEKAVTPDDILLVVEEGAVDQSSVTLHLSEAIEGIPPYTQVTQCIQRKYPNEPEQEIKRVKSFLFDWRTQYGHIGYVDLLETLEAPPDTLRDALDEAEVTPTGLARLVATKWAITGATRLPQMAMDLLYNVTLERLKAGGNPGIRQHAIDAEAHAYNGGTSKTNLTTIFYPRHVLDAMIRVAKTNWFPLIPQWASTHGYNFNRNWTNPCGHPNTYWKGTNPLAKLRPHETKLAHGATGYLTPHAYSPNNTYIGHMDPLWEETFIAVCEEVAKTKMTKKDMWTQAPFLLDAAASMPIIITPAAATKRPKFFTWERTTEPKTHNYLLKLVSSDPTGGLVEIEAEAEDGHEPDFVDDLLESYYRTIGRTDLNMGHWRQVFIRGYTQNIPLPVEVRELTKAKAETVLYEMLKERVARNETVSW